MPHILIVDDKEENCYFLKALLTGHDYAVEVAHHGAEALVLARQSPPELVISDLLMPVMDGYTLLRHWKTDARLKQIPFVVYTATYTEPEDEKLALSLGADAFIVKPTEPEEFMRRLLEVQAKLKTATPAVPHHAAGDEENLLKVYSEILIRKLEEKTIQLEEANAALQQDIEARKRAEIALRESEERFRATFEHAAVGIVHVAVAGNFVRVNDRFCAITGFSREELLQRTFTELTAEEDRAEGENARRAMLDGSQAVYAAEKRYQHKSGKVLWVNVVTTLLRDSAGTPQYFITVVDDVTERKLLQQQLLRAQRIESIGTLAGGIAHDLNNLLAPIVVGVDLLQLSVSDSPSRKILGTIAKSALRGTNLVKQVLSFARGTEGARVTVHLGHLVHEIDEFVHSTFPKNIIFTANVPKDTWVVPGDPTQLNQVLLNLCLNARDAMPGGGALTVTSRNVAVDEQYAAMLHSVSPGRYVLLEVTDTGGGIPQKNLERIFEPFFSTKEPGKGTGLGLSTVQTIVRSHGGGVWAESEPGRGTAFKILLPAQPESNAPIPLDVHVADLPRGHGELVLVVDDDASVLAMTQQTLEMFGYAVIGAEDGAAAIAAYATHQQKVAVVLMDIAMPVMDGAALVKALRRLDPAVRIIASSGIQESEALAAAAGVEHYLAKPYPAGALLEMISRMLRGASA